MPDLSPPSPDEFPAPNPNPNREALIAQFRISLGAQGATFISAWNQLAATLHAWNAANGFWPQGGRNFGEIIALAHSELSEALEAHRTGNPPSQKAQGYSSVEEELADLIIRTADACGGLGLRVGEAVIAKALYNLSRPPKHDKEY